MIVDPKDMEERNRRRGEEEHERVIIEGVGRKTANFVGGH